MKRLFALASFLLISVPLLAGPWYPIAPFKDPKVYKEGDWELRIYYLRKGTKSEGMNGDLTYKGKRIVPEMAPRYIQTPFGDVTFRPSRMHLEKHLNDPNIVIGWTFRDNSKIPWTIPNPPTREARSDWEPVEPEFQGP